MARVFVRLKLSLLANGFRRGWQQGLGIVISALYALPLALLASRALATFGRAPQREDVAQPALVLAFSVLWIGWLIGPLLAFGMDETLDPGRLRLLPLRRRDLIRGLLAASLVGIGPLATIVVLYGVVVGFAPATAGALVVLAAAGAQLLLCIAGARATTTALSRRLGSRRGRDVLTVAAALFGLAIAGLGQLPRLVLGDLGADTTGPRVLAWVQSTADALVVLPPAWPARAIAAAAAGDLGGSLLWLAPSVLAVAALIGWWSHGLARMQYSPAQPRNAERDADLFPALVRWLPRNRLGADIAKDLRYAWRVPQLRVQYLMLGVLTLPGAFFAARAASEPTVVLLAPLALLVLGTTAFNVFGADRGAVWMLDTTGPAPRTDLIGKVIAGGLLGVPIVTVLAVLLAAITGGWAYVPLAVALAVALHGVVTAVGMVVSVAAPFPLPDAPANVFAANAGAGCAAIVLQSVGLFLQVILAAPIAVVVVVALLRGPELVSAAALAALGWGGSVWWLGLRIATRRLTDRGPEFLAALQPRAG